MNPNHIEEQNQIEKNINRDITRARAPTTKTNLNHEVPQNTRKEIIRPRKSFPPNTHTTLNKPEPHGYIKNAAWARTISLYPTRRKNPPWSPLKTPVPEWQMQIIVGTKAVISLETFRLCSYALEPPEHFFSDVLRCFQMASMFIACFLCFFCTQLHRSRYTDRCSRLLAIDACSPLMHASSLK